MSTTDLVLTGLGVAAAGVYGAEELWSLVQRGRPGAEAKDYSMRGFKAEPYLKDRRHLKSVSEVDAFGLAALSGLVGGSGYTAGSYDSARVGLYVGAPAPAAADNDGYLEALAAARVQDGVSLRDFGATSARARPVTLLLGLANNVLCYGAMLLDARGANSNYTASALSGHHAVINAARRIRRGRLDLAVAGGFSGATDPVYTAMLRRHGLVGPGRAFDFAADSGAVTADGAAFVILEHRAGAVARGAPIMASYCGGAVMNDALGPLTVDSGGEAIYRVIHAALREACVGPEAVGLICSAASGMHAVDSAELRALYMVFAGQIGAPALACSALAVGHLMEAGGVLELGLVPRLYASGAVPEPLQPRASVAPFGSQIPEAKPYALILRTSAWGEYSCIVVRREDP